MRRPLRRPPGFAVGAVLGGAAFAASVAAAPPPVPEPWGWQLHAASIVWTDATHVRVTYDWATADQLLDWIPMGTNVATWTAGQVAISNAALGVVNGISWIGALAAARVSVVANQLTNGHTNIYTNLSKADVGQNVPPNGTGHVWFGGGLWIADGASAWHAGTSEDPSTWYEFVLETSGTTARAMRVDDGTWYDSTLTHSAPRLDGRVALGALNGESLIGTVVIEGEVDAWLPAPGEIGFATTGATFEPRITVAPGASILWTFDDLTTDATDSPSKNFGAAGLHHTTLRVTPWSALVSLDLGYDAADGGNPADPRLPLIAQQNVCQLWALANASALTAFAASYNPLRELDLANLPALDTVECYRVDGMNVADLTGDTAIARLCLEQCWLRSLDLSPCAALVDLRSALNCLPVITWGTTGAHVLHVCVRGNVPGTNLLPPAGLAQFPHLTELLIYGCNLPGTLAPVTDQALLMLASGCGATGIDLTGAPLAHWLEFMGNGWSEAIVDSVLATLAGGSVSGAGNGVWLTGNTAPSAAGLADVATLVARGWTVTHD